MTHSIAIVGRPNVGKSTLFNRLVDDQSAIIDNSPGVTRDRHYGYAHWIGFHFIVIDTGGYISSGKDHLEAGIRDQIKIALQECTVVFLVVDCQTGITGYDTEVAQVIRPYKKPVFVVANKADTPIKTALGADFYALGLGEVYPISAITGLGTGDLLDDVVKLFSSKGTDSPEEGLPKIAIMGRPNVGKSSLLNALLGSTRSLVADVGGTTRDAIHSRYRLYKKDFILIDTAGIRRKKKVREDIEFYAVLRSLKALESCDVCILIIDATLGLESQDVNLISLAQRRGKGVVIMVNKWDLLKKGTETSQHMKKAMMNKLAPIEHIPFVFGSALTRQRVFQVIEKALHVYDNKHQKITTSRLNQVLLPIITSHPPPALKGKLIRIKYVTQVPAQTPTLVFFCNLPQYIQESYRRFLENRIRKVFPCEGVPLKLFFRKK